MILSFAFFVAMSAIITLSVFGKISVFVALLFMIISFQCNDIHTKTTKNDKVLNTLWIVFPSLPFVFWNFVDPSKVMPLDYKLLIWYGAVQAAFILVYLVKKFDPQKI